MAKNSTVQENQDADKIHEENNQVNPAATAAEVKDAENKDAAEKEAQKADENTPVAPPKGDSPEEKAAERAGVGEENLDNPAQNRDPRTKFEKENQKNTEEKRKVAHEESNLSREEREEKAETPKETATADAARSAEANQGSEIAQAISQGLKDAKGDKTIKITVDKSVNSRFGVVRSKRTGEVMLRENETGVLSKVQLESLEEKEASIQGEEVEAAH